MENAAVVSQIEANESPDQVMLGHFPAAVQNAVMDSLDTHTGLAENVLRDAGVRKEFARVLLDAILGERDREQQSGTALR